MTPFPAPERRRPGSARPRPDALRILAPVLIAGLLLAACRREPAAGTSDAGDAPPPAKTPATRTVLYYYDPMRPDVHFEHPGRSPFMDMALLPKYADQEPLSRAAIAVHDEAVQALGIRIGTPTRAPVRPSVRTVAQVVADARREVRLQSRVSGWIERLHVRAIGERVAAGDVVAEIYSPELVRAQEELLLGGDSATAASERLRRLGVADVDIAAVQRAGRSQRRLPLRAPADGVVTALGVREGAAVSPDAVVLDLAATHAVWVEARLFPGQSLSLGRPLTAVFSLPGTAGPTWRAAGGATVPIADPVTQTLPVRFTVADAGNLPLGTWLDAEVAGAERADVLTVPARAVIRTAAGDRVLVEVASGRFVPQPVECGDTFGDRIEVRHGLADDARIVVSGQFLLDAEADLQAGLDRMAHAPEGGSP